MMYGRMAILVWDNVELYSFRAVHMSISLFDPTSSPGIHDFLYTGSCVS